jgi:hypothetical protein
VRVPLVDLPSSSYMWAKNGELLSNASKIAQAEARFKSSQKERDHKQSARNQYEADQDAIRKKTERLRALRLAKKAIVLLRILVDELQEPVIVIGDIRFICHSVENFGDRGSSIPAIQY